jgi:DnaJ domain
MRNKYGSTCTCCMAFVGPGEGYLFGKDPVTKRWDILCGPCSAEPVDAESRADRAKSNADAEAVPGPDDDGRSTFDRLFAALFGLDAGTIAGWPSVHPCYRTLGLTPPVDEAGIKRRFRQLAKEKHPDAGGDAREFMAIETAYREALALTGGPAR